MLPKLYLIKATFDIENLGTATDFASCFKFWFETEDGRKWAKAVKVKGTDIEAVIEGLQALIVRFKEVEENELKPAS